MKFKEMSFVEKLLLLRPYLIVLLVPIAFAILFGYAMGPIFVQNVPFAIYDMDHSSTSRSIVDSFYDCPTFKITEEYDSNDEIEEAILQSEVYGAAIIPEGFGDAVSKKSGAEAIVLIDGSNFQISNNVQQYATTIFTMANASIQMKYLAAGEMVPYEVGQSVYSMNIVTRNLFNSELGYLYYLFSGLLGVFIQQTYLAVAPSALIDAKKKLRNLPARPAGEVLKLEIGPIITELFVYSILSTISLISCLLIGHLGFGYPMNGSLWYVLIVQVVFMADIFGAALVIATIFDEKAHVIQFTMFLTVPTMLTCGFGWPEFLMPGHFAVIMKAIWPMYYFNMPLRDLMLKGADWSVIGSYIIGGLIYAAVWIPIGLLLFSHKVKLLKEAGIVLSED